MRATAWIPLLVLALALGAGGAHAADPRAEAKARYERGSVLFDLQRYDEAAVEYEAAYELKPDPAFLFNLGQAYRLAKKPEKATRAYSSYLRRMPQAKNREEIEQRIEEMKALEQQQKAEAAAARAAEPPAPAPTPPPAPAVSPLAPGLVVTAPAPLPPRVRTLKWTGLGLGLGGALVAVAGAGIYGVGQAAFHNINDPRMGAQFDPEDERKMNRFRPAGLAVFAVGLAATVTGFSLFGIHAIKEKRHARATATAEENR